MALYIPVFTPLLRCLRVHTTLCLSPKYRPDTGQKYRLIGDTSVFNDQQVLDHSDDEDELIGAANWWTSQHPHGSATVYARKD